MFNNKHATPYGPGAPKSPVPGAGLLGTKADMLQKNLLQAMDKHVAIGALDNPGPLTIIKPPDQGKSMINPWWDSLTSATTNHESHYYVKVATALGFTSNEVDALVRANDSGLSFLEIADLIGKHPPVWSAAMTPARRKEETDFIRLVDTVVANVPAPSKSWATIHDTKLLAQKMDALSMSTTPMWHWYSGLFSVNVGADLTALLTPKHGLVTPPKSGELAKLLGIWTP